MTMLVSTGTGLLTGASGGGRRFFASWAAKSTLGPSRVAPPLA
eukprot:CAMPEP_0113588404 /NCGR_PEP_ID=MMETSP0015_2-20120614/35492_1 /TAXON_ID=2838 /ORGANISM="Odontella" /LENGTH=42 /DNA_ID=CAMNT_0000494265 /DNA_START=51 /DNA_END=176 /DNA_ORIENTATION=+ /assembly_acc=CAM_ASM_000160